MKSNLFISALLFCASAFAQQLQLVSGNGQLVFEQFPSGAPFTVRAVDAAGAPIANTAVSWTVTDGLGTILTPMNATDSNGYATAKFLGTSIQPGTSWAAATVTATSAQGTASFLVTTVQSRLSSGPAPQPVFQLTTSGETLSGAPGTTIPGAFTVTVVASAGIRLGQGIPNVGVRVVLGNDVDRTTAPGGTCQGPGGVVLTDERGRATCNLTLNNNRGFGGIYAQTGEFHRSAGIALTITQGPACTISVNPVSQTVSANGGTGTFSILASNCSWTASTTASWITLQGTTTGSGNATLAFTAAPNTGTARSAAITVGSATFTVSQLAQGATGPLSFTLSPALPAATVGSSYSLALNAAGGQAPYTWTSTSVPAGLALNSTTGVLSGAATTAGAFSIPVTLRDAAGAQITQTFTLTVNPQGQTGGPVSFSLNTFPAGVTGTAYQQVISITGGCQNPFGVPRIDLASGTLPPGLLIQSSGTGATVAGTPTSAGSFPFALRATDPCGASTTRDFSITIAGSGTVTPSQLTAVPASLVFSYQRGGTAPPEQTITVGASTTALTFTATTSSAQNWVSATASGSGTPATVTVRPVNYTELQPGSYTGIVILTPPAPSFPITVAVTLNVTAPAPTLSLSPQSLSFSSDSGNVVPAPQSITIISTGPFRFNASATTQSGGPWLTLTPATGNAPAIVLVSANPSGLAAGTYTGNISVSIDGVSAAGSIPVTLRVNQSQTLPQISSIVSGADFVPGPIAPGEIVTLFGSNMGPETLTGYRLAPDGSLETTLSGARVWFDDQPAPLIYVSAGQTSVVVPYGIAGRVRVNVQAEYNGVRSEPMGMNLADAAPSLFPVIVNQDSTLNTSRNSAAAGSVVILYATGEGLTSPLGLAGQIVPADALARPVLPVRVFIGGREAEILYAGSAPGQIAGLMQVNVRLPQGSLTDSPLPVTLTVGNSSSRANATVWVRP